MIKLEGHDLLPLPYQAQLQVPSSLDALGDVVSWFAQLQHPSIPGAIWIRCQLALAEGFTNAVCHAQKNLSPDLLVDIKVTLTSEQIEIRIWDQGRPFDLVQKLREISPEVNQTAGRGRGLKIMRDIADHLRYERTSDQRNCLLIVKHYEPSVKSQQK